MKIESLSNFSPFSPTAKPLANEVFPYQKPFSEDQRLISEKEKVNTFIRIDPEKNFRTIGVISVADQANSLNQVTINSKLAPEFLNPVERGLEDDSDQYAFSAYPKQEKRFMLGKVKARLESFESITGNDHGTFRLLYGDSKGDKKFNFDGFSIGLDAEVRQSSFLTNKRPEIYLPANPENYFFEKDKMDLLTGYGNINLNVALEGVKVGIGYDKLNGISLSKLEFYDGAITTNLVDFTKDKPYIAVPIAAALAGGVVAGGYFLNKGKEPLNINLGNIIVYNRETETDHLKIGIAPSLSLTGAEKFVQAFSVPGVQAKFLYKHDNNLTIDVGGGYNPNDGANVFAGAAMKF